MVQPTQSCSYGALASSIAPSLPAEQPSVLAGCIYPPGPGRKAVPAEMEADLNKWCSEAADQWEFDHRKRGAEWIAKIYQSDGAYLTIQFESITSLPSSIGMLTALKELNLNRNKLTELPASIGNLTNLTKLNLDGNLLTALPDTISNLTALTNLVLSNNEITALPDHFGNLTRLTHLDLRRNFLPQLPASFYNITTLIELDLSTNELTALPNAISALTALKKLDLNSNRIVALPATFSALTALENVNLCNNQLTHIPPNMDLLIGLRNLDLSVNLFAELPLPLTRLAHECVLDLNGNRLTQLTTRNFRRAIREAHAANPAHGPRFEFSIHEGPMGGGQVTLAKAITEWLKEFEAAFAKSGNPAILPSNEGFLKHYEDLLIHRDQEILLQFLNRLRSTPDYRTNKKSLLMRVQQMLNSAAEDKDFRAGLFPLIETGLGTCGDRVALAFNHIEILWHTCCNPECKTPQGLSKLIIGLKRVEMLEEIAKRDIEILRLGDHIEVYLFYQVRLREALGLPVSTQGMLYAGMSGVTAAMQIAAKDHVLAQTSSLEQQTAILIDNDDWVRMILGPNAYAIDAIEAEFGTLMEALDTTREWCNEQGRAMEDHYYNQRINQINTDRKAKIRELARALTYSWLIIN